MPFGLATLSSHRKRPGSPYDLTFPDLKFFTKGSYFCYASPWGRGALISPVDYLDTISIQSASFPANTLIQWRWPTDVSTPVFGFMCAGYGNYDWSVVQNQVTPRQISGITAFTSSFSYTATGPHYDVLHELYLTVTPHQNDPLTDKKFEVGFIYYADAATIAWINTGAVLGVWTDAGGKQWKCTGRQGGAAGYYIIFFPVDELTVLSGTLDWKAALLWLTGLGLSLTRQGDASPTPLTSAFYVNGVAMGAEVIDGGGSGQYLLSSYSASLS